jgi:uncharacterized protein DUF6603/galactose oxidase-like protein
MVDQPNTLDALATELGAALAGVEGALTPANFTLLLTELGVDNPPDLTADTAFARTLGAAATAATALASSVEELVAADDAAARADAAARIVDGIRGFGEALHALASDFQRATAGLPDAGDLALFAATLVERLVGAAVVGYLDLAHPFLRRVLSLLAIVEMRPVGVQPDDVPPVVRRVLHLDRLTRLVTDPLGVIREVYGWGDATFDGRLLLASARDVFDVLVPVATARDADEDGPADLDLFGLFVQVATGAVPPGLEAGLFAGVTGPVEFDLAQLGDNLRVVLSAKGTLAEGLALRLSPPASLELTGGAGAAGVVALDIVGESPDPADPFVIFGAPGGIRLTANRVAAGLTTEFAGSTGTGTATGDLGFHADVTGAELVVDTTDADGFISTVLPSDGLATGFDFGLTWSQEHGFTFRGGGALETTVPVSVQLGPVTITGVNLGLLPQDTALAAEVSADILATLGPFTAAVSRLGLNALFTHRPDQDGNLGPVDMSIAFKAPTGVALAVDAGVIAGGGFLSLDAERGEYAGALELELADFLAIKGIGLITTRQPDGAPGFSLLIVLTAEFPTGIQLGAGFTLLAVGGLVGLNRGMNLQALVEGVRSATIESVAFPKDVIANAPRILSDLSRFFPQEQGTFLIGPMVKIGWGTPTLISASVGVIIEVPGDIAVLGVVRAVLPTVDEALVVIQAQFLGALELDRSRMWFFATLFKSRILSMTVDGSMGILVSWGESRELIVSVGGFHPSFRPPPLPFPTPDRLTVNLLNRGGQLVRVTGYFAITPNTIQFGGGVYVLLGFSGFRVEGNLTLDGLINRDPFRYSAHTSGDVSLKAFGVGLFTISLDFTLEGPAPWRAHGRGSIGFLFFSVSADFDISWGEELAGVLPPIPVLPFLADELGKTESWETRLPSGGTRTLVTLRTLPEGSGDSAGIVLHPLGTLTVRQRALPLNVRVDRVGGRRASDGKRFRVTPDGAGLTQASVTGDKFAMAQFQNMSDAAKLSRPSYETQDAGLELTSDTGTLATARVVRRAVRYELHMIDTARPAAVSALASTPAQRFHSVSAPVFDELRRGASTTRSTLSARRARQRQPFAARETVRVDEQRFVVAYVRSNRQAFRPSRPGRPRVAATFRSRATAEDALTDFVVDDPALAGQLHVIPAAEAAVTPGVPGTWSPAGILPTPVSTVDLVLLPTGRLLLAGGADPDGAAVATTALFDPTGDSWSAGPALGVARQRHTTTRLPDGRVLVVGGQDAKSAPLASAEVLDAVRWTPAHELATARSGHTATLLRDGRVLVVGGTGTRDGQEDGALTSAELFDPSTGGWTATGSLVGARTGHQAVLLANGHVLVSGGVLLTGRGRADPVAYCEVWDPATGEWRATGSLREARAGHQAVLLPDRRVLVTGGDPVVAADGTLDPHSLASAELYDPDAGVWSAARPMPGGGRGGHRALVLRSGAVLVTGGTGAPERTGGFRSVIAYDPGTGTWSALGALLSGRTAHAAAELPDDRVLVAAGVSGADPTGTGEVLIP